MPTQQSPQHSPLHGRMSAQEEEAAALAAASAAATNSPAVKRLWVSRPDKDAESRNQNQGGRPGIPGISLPGLLGLQAQQQGRGPPSPRLSSSTSGTASLSASTPAAQSPLPSSATTIGCGNDATYKLERNIRQSFGPRRYHRFVLYETKARFWLVGSNKKKTEFSLLKIDRTQEAELFMQEDTTRYSRTEVQGLLQMIAEGNASHGGLQRRASAYGILGFIRFLHGYYLLLITKRKKVGSIGVHSIYKVSQVTDLYIPHPDFCTSKPSRGWQESKYKTLFFSMALNHFYFSYSYDLTRTLQFNMTAEHKHRMVYNEGFVWNEFLLQEMIRVMSRDSPWILPMIHGYLKENKFSVNGRQFNVVLIARRSRHFAGTRFLKRGVNERGQVANAVECEQIVYDEASSITQLSHDFTSFVQIRGSIPLFWGQDGSVLAPKPPIAIQRVDPFYTATILHFEDLFRNFGVPIIVLNLVKHEEKKPRESLLGDQFQAAVEEINQSIPEELRLRFINCDFSRFSKTKGCDVVAIMNEIAEASLKKTGYFHAGKWLYANYQRRETFPEPGHAPYADLQTPGRYQTGLLRSNCIDSLDRTNAAQFITGKVAFGNQLYALGVTDDPAADFDSPTVQILLDMYQGMGNTLALQYGGSRLAHTIGTYREKTLAHHSRDLLASLKRFYSNSFTDKEKQDSINLFLGNFCPWREKVNLWELETDYHLHMKKAESFPETFLFTNRKWWEPALKMYYSRILSQPLVSLSMLVGNASLPPPDRSLLLKSILDDLYDQEQMSSFDLIFSRPSNVPIQISIGDTDPAVSFKKYLLQNPDKSPPSATAPDKSVAELNSSHGKKGQMLLSLYGIKKWFTFVQDNQKSGSTSLVSRGIQRITGSRSSAAVPILALAALRSPPSAEITDIATHLPAHFNPYQIFGEIPLDTSIRLDCLYVDVPIYREYLSLGKPPAPLSPAYSCGVPLAPSTSPIVTVITLAPPPPPRNQAPLQPYPCSPRQPGEEPSVNSPRPEAQRSNHREDQNKPFCFTISPESTACYAHYASLSQPSFIQSLTVETAQYERAVALNTNLTIGDLKCSHRAITAIKASFQILGIVASSSLHDGWFCPH